MKILINNSKILFFFFIISFFFINKNHLFAQEDLNLYFFWGDGCPHCKSEKAFLNKLSEEYPNLKINEYEIWYSPENRKVLEEVANKLNVDVNGVPFLVIGDQHIVGFLNEETTGKQITELIESCTTKKCPDVLSNEYTNSDTLQPKDVLPKVEESPKDINIQKVIPFNIDISNLSLPIISAVLGFLDGFNPCAMWTLLFLISLLLGMQDKKKMWILGIAFIGTSAFVYFLFMVAWLNILLFISYLLWVRLIIGLVALGGGILSLRKAITSNTSCDLTNNESRKTVFKKMGEIVSNKSFIFSLIGIIGLAFAVNLIELICSAGLPAVYSQILAMNNLNYFQYYGYSLIYIFFFMIDDLFVFFVAMITMQSTGITTKYVKHTRWIGGLLMIAIGLLMILKPEILMNIGG